MIYIDENFLNVDECNYFIDLFKNSKNITRKYRNTEILNTKLLYNEHIDKSIKKIVNKIQFLFNEKCSLSKSELVLWPTESYQNPHYDPPGDLCACVIYLNDSYSGGNTCFSENFKIKPETGKCLIFSNSKYLHWVEKITDGNRYTFSSWFINKHTN